MSPIDDELRALLHERAGTLPPAPDPLGGIEARARGLRRRRALAVVSSTAVVVAAIAVAVPLALGDGGGAAVRVPAGSPTATVLDRYALDPAHPWEFRGTNDDAALARFTADYTRRHPDSGATALWGERYEPSGRYEAALVLESPHGNRYAFAVASPSGTSFLVDEPLPDGTRALAFVVPGDEQERLVVLTSPDVDRIDYAPDGTTYTQLAQLAPGVAVGPATGTSDAVYRALAADGSVVASGPVAAAPDTPPGDPTNLLAAWVHRGDRQQIPDATVVDAFVRADPGTAGHYRSLYDGTSGGLGLTIGQAWHDGDAGARLVAYDTDGTFFLGPVTPRDPWLVAAVFSRTNAADLLVLLPRPGAGRVGYAPSATAPFNDVASGRSDLDPVGLVDRDPKALDDRVQVHRGDDSVVLTVPVASLTCGAKECG